MSVLEVTVAVVAAAVANDDALRRDNRWTDNLERQGPKVFLLFIFDGALSDLEAASIKREGCEERALEVVHFY